MFSSVSRVSNMMGVSQSSSEAWERWASSSHVTEDIVSGETRRAVVNQLEWISAVLSNNTATAFETLVRKLLILMNQLAL